MTTKWDQAWNDFVKELKEGLCKNILDKYLTGESKVRELAGHKVNPANDKLVVEVVDEPGSGGASHRYRITGFNSDTNPSKAPDEQNIVGATFLFQNGPIAEVGVNGITHEALLAILIDRMEAFQSGPYMCEENAAALAGLLSAQHWLQQRTKKRMDRGVEGTHKV